MVTEGDVDVRRTLAAVGVIVAITAGAGAYTEREQGRYETAIRIMDTLARDGRRGRCEGEVERAQSKIERRAYTHSIRIGSRWGAMVGCLSRTFDGDGGPERCAPMAKGARSARAYEGGRCAHTLARVEDPWGGAATLKANGRNARTATLRTRGWRACAYIAQALAEIAGEEEKVRVNGRRVEQWGGEGAASEARRRCAEGANTIEWMVQADRRW